MGPRPYSENSSIPETANSEPVTAIPTQILTETPTPSTASGATTPSPTPQEIIPVEQHVESVVIQEDGRGDGLMPCYPTPGDIMPYDHSLPDFIRQITNERNLANLHSLSLRVISTCISLHRMSAYLPNLRELDLEGSILNSLRDIGCSFKNLQILKVGRCQLESLDGTFGLSGLRELYAEKNLINDVSPCSNLPHIKHIDVSWNRIRNISYAGFLSVCNKLKSIIFTGNPATEVEDYRKHVRRILPQIEALDGVPFTNDDNTEESKDVDLIENYGNESDSSIEIPDFSSISPSDSMNNLLESEEDINTLEKRCKQAKNAANQDQFEFLDQDVQGAQSSGPGNRTSLEEELKNLTLLRNKEGVLDRPKATKFTDSRNINIQQKCTSIQKLNKDIENRSKKSNFLSKSNYGDDFVSLPEIVSNPVTSQAPTSKASTSTFFFSMEGKKGFSRNDSTSDLNMPETSKQSGNTRETQMMHLKPTEQIILEPCNPPESETKTGALKRKSSITVTMIPGPIAVSSSSDITETITAVNPIGTSFLTTGSPVRGNITAALRSRNKQQESKDVIKSNTMKNPSLNDEENDPDSERSSADYELDIENDVKYLQELLLGSTEQVE